MASLTDYKISRIVHLPGGSTEALIRFYEGDITTEDEEDIDGEPGDVVSVTRYRRISKNTLREINYNAAARVSDDDIRTAMDIELATDLIRTPIDEQKIRPPTRERL